jgi:hypothetical protein
MRIVLFAATAAILATVSPAFASRDHIVCKSCVSKLPHVRFPICHTVREPIGLRHGYMIYLPHEICR